MNILPENEGMQDYAFPKKRRKFKWHRIAYGASIAVLFYLLFFHDAIAHEFYSIECCDFVSKRIGKMVK